VRSLDGARAQRLCLAWCRFLDPDPALNELFEAIAAPFSRLTPSECAGPPYVEADRTDACRVMRP